MATTILKLANMSKDADKIVKTAREWESKTLNNEVEIEQLDVQMREAKRIGIMHFCNKLFKCIISISFDDNVNIIDIIYKFRT